jgi:Uma2 family endonuclease
MADQGSIRAEPAPVRFTGRQVLAMLDAGVLERPNRIELIGGELIDLGSEGALHLPLRVRLTNWLIRKLPDTITVNPDISILPSSIGPLEVRGRDLMLVIEISDSSVAFDLGPKAALYARHGVREYWVIDANTGRTHVHLHPEGEGWQSVAARAPHEVLQATLLREIALAVEIVR